MTPVPVPGSGPDGSVRRPVTVLRPFTVPVVPVVVPERRTLMRPAAPEPHRPRRGPRRLPVRRRLLAVLAVATATVVSAGCEAPLRESRGPRSRGAEAGSVPRRRPRPVRWSATVRDGPLGVVADDRGVAVVLFDRVIHLDPSSGSERWAHRDPMHDPEAVALGRTAVVIAAAGRRLVALDRSDGRVLWWSRPGGEIVHPAVLPAPRMAPAPGRPTGLDTGLVTAFAASTGSGRLLGLEASTGEVRWRAAFPGRPIGPLVAADGGRVAVGVWGRVPSDPSGSVLRAVDPSDGSVLWERPGPRRSRPATAGDLVFVVEWAAGRAALRAYHAGDGEVAWGVPVASPVQESAAPGVGPAGVAVAGEAGTVALVDPSTGRRRWESRLADADVAVLGSPVVGATEIVVPLAASTLVVVSATGGRVVEVLPRGVAVGPARSGRSFVAGWRWVDPARVDARPLR